VQVAKKHPVTRAERRAARVVLPDARVYWVEIEDAGAQCWVSRLAFFADSPAAAKERLRAIGLWHALDRSSSEVELPVSAAELAKAHPNEIFISQLDDDGWTRWFALPAGYVHPSQGQAAKHPELRLSPPPDENPAS
jgi:hypothetical protein